MRIRSGAAISDFSYNAPRQRPIRRAVECNFLAYRRHATGFHCTMHGKFKVTDTIVLDGYTRQRWEVAPKKAQLRTKVFLRRLSWESE